MRPLSPADVDAIRELTATHLRTGVQGDWAAWTATCTDDVVLVPPGTEHVHGREAAEAWFQDFPELTAFTGEPTVVRGDGDMAFSTGVAQATMLVDGEEQRTQFKWLAVFQRQPDGEWKMMADAWNDLPL